MRDISLITVGALIIGFPIGYIIGGVLNREFYKNK